MVTVSFSVEVVRQRIETEGLRPFSMRTGIPLGQLRSVVQGRASRYTTLQSIASAMGMRLFIAPAEPGGMEAPPLPAELTRALDLPSDASVVDAVEAIDQDAVASTLRKGMRLVLEMTELATAAAELLPQVAGGSTTRMIPFAEHVRFEADTDEVAFEESSDLSIAVAERVLPSWARAARLTCVRTAGDSLEPADGALVVVDKDRRVGLVVCLRNGFTPPPVADKTAKPAVFGRRLQAAVSGPRKLNRKIIQGTHH